MASPSWLSVVKSGMALVLAPAALGQPTYPSGSYTPRLTTASDQSISRSIHVLSPVAR